MAKKEHMRAETQDQNTSLWMVTFSDLIMLLLTFFVLLLTMSSLDQKRLRELFLNFSETAGILELSGSREITNLQSFINRYRETESVLVVDQNLLKNLFIPSMESDSQTTETIEDLGKAVDIIDDERGIVISFHENILFDPGGTTINKMVIPVLDSIVTAIHSCPNDILIMGHTDDVPIHTDHYESNWELSLYRGLSVLRYLSKEKDVPLSRFSVGGYGPTRPLWPNDGPKNRSFNRRVEIIFKHL
jgi:chemotaxis protein MotB